MTTNVREEWVNQARNDQDNIKQNWWHLEPNESHKGVFRVVQAIKQVQSYRFMQQLRFARLYSNMEMMGFPFGFYSRTLLDMAPENRVTYNVIKSCVDTVASKIAKSKPRPIFLTTDGNYEQQQRAKKMTKYLDGAFDMAEVYPHAQRMFVDGCVFGLGILKVYKDVENAKVCVDRVFPIELIIDDGEGIYGYPRQMHQEKYISRDVVLGMFGEDEEKRNKILSCSTGTQGDWSQYSSADMLTVIESWHLKAYKDGKGKHVISINNCTLLEEEYDKDWFPFVIYRWNQKLLGFYGTGLAEELTGIQVEINRMLRTIQMANHLVAAPRVLIEDGSKVNSNHINNEVGSIIKYHGTPPQFVTPSIMPAEYYMHLENLVKKSYEITGVSQLSASQKKPSGIDSGVALREYQDIESERFMLTAMNYENCFLDIASKFMTLSKELFEENPNLAVKVNLGQGLDRLKWKEVQMEEDEYVIRMFPTSLLPTQPQARLQKVQEYIQAGWIDKENAMELLDFPDDTAFTNIATSSLKIIKKMIFMMLNEGKYQSPEPYMDLVKAKTVCQLWYLEARTTEVKDDRLELLRRFMEDCDTMIAQAQAQMAPPQAPQVPGGPQAAMPAPLPQGDLVQNVPAQ